MHQCKPHFSASLSTSHVLRRADRYRCWARPPAYATQRYTSRVPVPSRRRPADPVECCRFVPALAARVLPKPATLVPPLRGGRRWDRDGRRSLSPALCRSLWHRRWSLHYCSALPLVPPLAAVSSTQVPGRTEAFDRLGSIACLDPILE